VAVIVVLIVLAAVWAVVVLTMCGLCWAAAKGDAVQLAGDQPAERRFRPLRTRRPRVAEAAPAPAEAQRTAPER